MFETLDLCLDVSVALGEFELSHLIWDGCQGLEDVRLTRGPHGLHSKITA